VQKISHGQSNEYDVWPSKMKRKINIYRKDDSAEFPANFTIESNWCFKNDKTPEKPTLHIVQGKQALCTQILEVNK
jgi:hypothetical protein